MSKGKKVHLGCFTYNLASACGIALGLDDLTYDFKEVTCNNCKRTKAYKDAEKEYYTGETNMFTNYQKYQVNKKKTEMENKIYTYYLRDENKKPYATVVFEVNEDGSVNRGVSYCNPHDDFNKKIGREIALGRMYKAKETKLSYSKDNFFVFSKATFNFMGYYQETMTEKEEEIVE